MLKMTLSKIRIKLLFETGIKVVDYLNLPLLFNKIYMFTLSNKKKIKIIKFLLLQQAGDNNVTTGTPTFKPKYYI